jgi:hypothetical protein
MEYYKENAISSIYGELLKKVVLPTIIKDSLIQRELAYLPLPDTVYKLLLTGLEYTRR